MIFTFPYHDPEGTYNEVFRRQMAHLKAAFDSICVSISPLTVERNADFVAYLEAQGCHLFRNPPGSRLGDHLRQALHLAVDQAQDRRPIFYGFIDRILFTFDTGWRERVLQDLRQCQSRACVIFERTPFAWDTHPTNYREIEQMVSRSGEWLYGAFIEWTLCGLLLSPATASSVIAQSTSPTMEVLGEWLLLAIKNDVTIATKKVDWALWEDPYWEQVDAEVLKQQRERSSEETIKRLKMNAPFMLLMAEERFKDLRPRFEHL